MVKKIELIYSPSQVSNHFKKTDQTVHWEVSLPSSFEPVDLLVEVTFKCRDFQTDVPFNETFQDVLRALNLDHVPRPRLNVRLAMKSCPVECMETVTMEILHWRNTFSRSDNRPERIFRFFHTNAPGRSMKKLTPSQLYQISIVNCMGRVNSELLPNTINMLYGLKGSKLMGDAVSFNLNDEAWSGLVTLEFGCHHKTSALDLTLLQRNLCLVFFLGIASLGEFTHPLPNWERWNTIQIILQYGQSSIPAVTRALRFLLNTLSYFHVFLPIGLLFCLRAMSSPCNGNDFYWNSMSPFGRLEVPDVPLFGSYVTFHINIFVFSEYPDQLLSGYKKGNPRLESHPHLLPKS